MIHNRENQTTRWRWEHSALPLLLAVCSFLASSLALQAQNNPAPPPAGSRISKKEFNTWLAKKEEEKEWNSWLAKKEEGWAAYNIAKAYHDAVNRDELESSAKRHAFDYYLKSATTGYGKAQANVGFCYDTGFGTNKNQTIAKKWYEQAAKQGNKFGQLNYAQHLLNDAKGVVDIKSIQEARKWFEEAYRQDDKLESAAYGIGMTYALTPNATADDLGKARDWLLQSRESHESLFALGALDEGQGHYGSAVEFYRRAKNAGSLAAAYNLGRCLNEGLGVAQNKQEAIKEFRHAAKMGHSESQYALGLSIYNASNTPAGYIEAIMWWRIAHKNGFSKAGNALRIVQNSRLLTEDEISMAERQATELEKTIKQKTPIRSQVNQFDPSLGENTQVVVNAISAFFVTPDGWLLTSSKELKSVYNKGRIDIGYSVKVRTDSGQSSEISKIIFNDYYSYAAIKVEGKYSAMPLSLSSAKGTKAKASTLINPAGDPSFIFINGEIDPIDGVEEKEHLTLRINTLENESYSNILSFNSHGQTTGFLLREDVTIKVKNTKNIHLRFLRSHIIAEFLDEWNSNTEKQPSTSSELSLDELKNLSRHATATVYIYKK